MNSYERQQLEKLPQEYRPLGAWAYFGYSILFAIPIVGLICMIVFALSDSNINRRNYARSFFCMVVIVVVVLLIVLLFVLLFTVVGNLHT